MKSFVSVCFLLQITGVHCYADGAPPTSCVNLAPNHNGITALTSATPYTITASASTYSPNQEITVTISGTESHGGILVQARKSDDSSATPIGTFMTPSMGTKVLQCSVAADSWTHSTETAKTTSTVIWIAPPSDAGTVMFKATVATDKVKYWLNHITTPLTYRASKHTGNSGSRKSVVSCLLIIMCLLGLQL